MLVSAKGRKFLEDREGWKSRAYKDSAGLWTIGVGHLLTPHELANDTLDALPGVSCWLMTSPEQVDALFAADLDRFEKAVSEACQRAGFLPNENQFDALVCLAFNIGVQGFENSTVAHLLGSVAVDPFAVYEAWRRWNKVRDKNPPHDLIVDDGLVKRRELEIELFKTAP